MRIVPLLLALLFLPACAVRPAEVRVGFDATRITSASARGVADRATGRRVTPDDPVRVASVSKLVVAMGVMRLVEAGTLDLDRDVSTWLGWSLRNPAHPDAPITLRHLLSHTSGLRDGVQYWIPLGGSVRAALADPKAWDPAHPPGRFFTYSNLGFPVIGSVIEKATGARFDAAMARHVFRPLKLDACFNWPECSDAKVARHVVLYDAKGPVWHDDLKGKRPECPTFTRGGCDLSAYVLGDNGALFSPQGGMRISMRDLARFGQILLKEGDGFLTPQSIATITTPLWTFDGQNGATEKGFYCSYGLATEILSTPQAGCRDDLFGDGVRRVGHAGEAYGLRSGLWVDRTTGRGVAFFTSAVPDDMSDGQHSAFTAPEERLARGK
ncbi:MAG: serine hydrolase domain-containing protein [Sphingomonadaceae bacterium]